MTGRASEATGPAQGPPETVRGVMQEALRWSGGAAMNPKTKDASSAVTGMKNPECSTITHLKGVRQYAW